MVAASASRADGSLRSASARRPPLWVARKVRVEIPVDVDTCHVVVGERTVRLTNLRKVFWTEPRITKGDLLRYYAVVAPYLLPHLRDRAMVMKRYPDGADGSSFFMKRAPEYRPAWLEVCPIEHASNDVIEFPVVQDLASLLWVVNLGCIGLNPWYATCDDVNRPDVLHFDLDPVAGTPFERVREAAVLVRHALGKLGMKSRAKTTGSRGIHVYVPIVRGPTQSEVWGFARELGRTLASARPQLITTEFRVAQRPRDRVLVDYDQNAWGRTLASVYSVRPRPRAPVSMPVTWREIAQGVELEDFRIDNTPARLARVGDLWSPMLARRGRFNLAKLL